MRVYLAGPMSGIPEFNFPEFFKVETALVRRGHQVWNPARHDQEMGFDATGTTGQETLAELGFSKQQAFDWDTQRIVHDSDGLVLLPGWEQSSGSKAEYALARTLGLLVFLWLGTADTLYRMDEQVMLHV